MDFRNNPALLIPNCNILVSRYLLAAPHIYALEQLQLVSVFTYPLTVFVDFTNQSGTTSTENSELPFLQQQTLATTVYDMRSMHHLYSCDMIHSPSGCMESWHSVDLCVMGLANWYVQLAHLDILHYLIISGLCYHSTNLLTTIRTICDFVTCQFRLYLDDAFSTYWNPATAVPWPALKNHRYTVGLLERLVQLAVKVLHFVLFISALHVLVLY